MCSCTCVVCDCNRSITMKHGRGHSLTWALFPCWCNAHHHAFLWSLLCTPLGDLRGRVEPKERHRSSGRRVTGHVGRTIRRSMTKNMGGIGTSTRITFGRFFTAPSDSIPFLKATVNPCCAGSQELQNGKNLWEIRTGKGGRSGSTSTSDSSLNSLQKSSERGRSLRQRVRCRSMVLVVHFGGVSGQHRTPREEASWLPLWSSASDPSTACYAARNSLVTGQFWRTWLRC